MGVEFTLRGPGTVVPLRPDYEHALVVLQGRVTVGGAVVEPGVLAYLGLGRDESVFGVEAPARACCSAACPSPSLC